MRDSDRQEEERGRRRLAEFMRKHRRPLLGLGIAGTALPLVRAGQPAEPARTRRYERPQDTTHHAQLDAEEAVAQRIAASRSDVERERQVAQAVEQYDIERDLAEQIHDIAREEGISTPVAFGLVRTESTFRRNVVSHAGARGLTQVLPSTARSVLPEAVGARLFEPATNLRAGFRYLRQLLDRYRGDVRLALLAYNRGPTNVDRILERGGNPDNGYADRVLGG